VSKIYTDQDPKFSQNISRGFTSFLFGTGLMGMIFPAGAILIGQTYLYMRDGEWYGLSILDGITYFEKYLSPTLVIWLYSPSSWYGLHKVLSSTALSVFFFLLGMGIVWLAIQIDEALN